MNNRAKNTALFPTVQNTQNYPSFFPSNAKTYIPPLFDTSTLNKPSSSLYTSPPPPRHTETPHPTPAKPGTPSTLQTSSTPHSADSASPRRSHHSHTPLAPPHPHLASASPSVSPLRIHAHCTTGSTAREPEPSRDIYIVSPQGCCHWYLARLTLWRQRGRCARTRLRPKLSDRRSRRLCWPPRRELERSRAQEHLVALAIPLGRVGRGRRHSQFSRRWRGERGR